MPLKKTHGNMYDWVTHTHSHLAGKCSHECSYCYVQAMEARFKSGKYIGPLSLMEKEFDVKYGEGRTIFIEHMNDMFAMDVPDNFIGRILNHVNEFPMNTYVFQTKNPSRMWNWVSKFPKKSILGTTIESNRIYPTLSKAPSPFERVDGMLHLPKEFPRFLTIEPVLDFDVDILASWIYQIHPDFLNLGADSKGFGLPEPTVEKIMQLVDKLKEYGIELREKHNLQRLLQK